MRRHAAWTISGQQLSETCDLCAADHLDLRPGVRVALRRLRMSGRRRSQISVLIEVDTLLDQEACGFDVILNNATGSASIDVILAAFMISRVNR